MLEEYKEKLLKKKNKLSRHIEYRRLKRVRRKRTPAYSYCKNCGKKLKGMYCSQCGQYALDIEQPFWKYLLQYIENVYQFDGKVWLTLYYLFRHPGFLTREFNSGKISSYVHPLRLFMFLSCIFFIFAFSLIGDFNEIKTRTEIMDGLDIIAESEEEEYIGDSEVLKDTVVWSVTDTMMLSGYKPSLKIMESPYSDTFRIKVLKYVLDEKFSLWENSDSIYVLDEDSLHKAVVDLPKIKTQELRNLRSEKEYNKLVSWYSSNWPLIALLLIPVFAVLLKLFFRKEKLGYMMHLVFALHIHCVLLIISAIMLVLLWNGINISLIYNLSLAYFFVYSIFAVRRVYSRNSWLKAIVKTVLLYGGYLIIWTVVFVLSLLWISENILE
ncbi:MAG: DUF3667 domain-containing protein [Parabacteroides sp.]|nr:DUF3667 domain-containing protein [Parabacteroides sp.]